MKILLEKIGFFTIVFLMVFFAIFLVLEVANLNKVVYGVYLGDQPIGGMTRTELTSFLDEKTKNYQDIAIKANESAWKANLQDLGLEIDKEKTVDAAFLEGRSRNIFSGMFTQIRAFVFGKKIKAIVSLNPEPLNEFLSEKISKIGKDAENAKFSYDGDSVFVDQEKLGSVIDKEALKKEIISKVEYLESGVLDVSFKVDYPEISYIKLFPLKEEAEKIIKNAPYLLEENDHQKWQIDKDQIKDWLYAKTEKNGDIKLTLNQEKLKDFLIQISPSINREPKDAILAVENGKVKEFVLSEKGVELDVENSAVVIDDKILKEERNITLVTNDTLPEIRTDNIENLGIITKLSTGESDFSGSISSRISNVKLGAKKLNGILIRPGEEFSTVEALGDIGPQNGWLPAYVIKDGKTTLEYGGGACQLSTTLFRAAMLAGLKITERFPHSYPVHYYNPQGFDAAIYGPHPDMRFVNDTGKNILIQSRVSGTKLYFDFYGTDDGRKVEIVGPEEYDHKSDGSLKAKLTRKIYDSEGTLLTEKTYWSTYKSPALYPTEKNPLE